jgi:hypothetical protein
VKMYYDKKTAHTQQTAGNEAQKPATTEGPLVARAGPRP